MNDSITILLIESNSEDVCLIKELLDKSTNPSLYTIKHVVNLSDALKVIKKDKTIDIILSDVTLPDSVRTKTFVKLRDSATHLPIIFITDPNNESLALKAINQGAQDYLLKNTLTNEILVRSIRYSIERKKMEDKLARSTVEVKDAEINLHRLLMQAPAAIAVVEGKNHVYKIANSIYQKVFNRKESQLLGKTMKEVFPEVEGQGIYEIFDRVFTTGEPFVVNEYAAAFDRDGTGNLEQGYFNFIAQPIKDEKGNVSSTLIHAIEVTEQVLARNKTKESEERFRTLIEKSADAIQLVSPEGCIQYSSNSVEAVLGYKPEEIQHHFISKYIHPDDCEMISGKLALILKSKRSQTIAQYRVKHKNGDWVWIEATVVNHLDNPLINALVGNFRNITKRKKTEEALKESEERLQTLANNIPNLAWMANADGWISWYNCRWYEYTGTTPKQMEGWGWQSVHDPEQLPKVMEKWQQSIERGELFEMIIPLRGVDGIFRSFLTRVVPIRDDNRNILRWFGTNTDVTEQQNIQEEIQRLNENLEKRVRIRTKQLTRANKELERSNLELQDFAYVASHDLQEPLRKVQAFGDRLKSKYGNIIGEEGADYINRMQNASSRMQTLIHDLLAFSRVSTQARPFEKVNLNEIIHDVLSNLEIRINELHADIEVQELCEIDGDPSQMHQLFQNLIGNALKFHKPDQKPVVKVYCEIDELNLKHRACKIFVEDNGIGFDETFLDRIFVIFQRLHTRNDYEGTGIGLAVCRKIAERHNGLITAKSSPGKGATFILTLPIKQKDTKL